MVFVSEVYQLVTDLVMHFPCSFIRRIYAKMVFLKFGKGSQIARHAHIMSPHRIEVGENVFINRNVTLDGRKGLKINDNVDIGEFSSVWSLQHDPDDINHHSKGGTTIIKDHVWIAPHSVILPGVIIGRGSVIGTMSVVTKDVPEKVLVAGIPAKKIRERNNPLLYNIDYKIFL